MCNKNLLKHNIHKSITLHNIQAAVIIFMTNCACVMLFIGM